MSVDEAASTERFKDPQDFSNVQGFQVVGLGVRTAIDAGQCDDRWRDALTQELGARAARFHQSVDASIVLANDGVIRWLGEPIAKLTPGPDLLTPRAFILADDALPEAAREIVAARLELWLAATTRRLLGPLFALQALQDETDAVREVARKVAQSLGILDREPIRNQIKQLDQSARAALRKHSVRFGAYYIYVPTVLKPAARVLALQLWGLQSPSAGVDALAQTLAPLASSGRTSLPYDPLISKESYCVAGFRPCGDRIVRVDIVERLADMIRAAFIERSAKDDSGRVARGPLRGFVVSGQMTSLTGCSGDHFSSILRSLGFECVETKRSDFFVDPPASESRPPDALSAPSEVLGSSTLLPEERLSEVCEAATELSADSASEPEAPARIEPSAEIGFRELAAEGGADEPEGESGGQTTLLPTAVASSASASSVEKETILTDTITVWRPAHKAPHGRKGRPVRQAGTESSGRASSSALRRDRDRNREGGRSDRPAPVGERDTTRPVTAETASIADASPMAERSNGPPANEKRRQPAANRGMHRARSNSGPEERPAVDPNSPFAKLVELRSLLEAQSKKRP